MEFEWDPNKAASNLRKHGIAFKLSTRVFSDRNWIERYDHEYHSEDRCIIVVVYTERKETIRLLSARKAERHEQED